MSSYQLPPNYYDRANDEKTVSSESFPEYYYYSSNGPMLNGCLCSSDGVEYKVESNLHRSKDSSITLHAKDTSRIGSLSFPATHNNFQIHGPAHQGNGSPSELLQIRARIGHPHPTSYSFTLPPSSVSPPRKVVWTKLGDSRPGRPKPSSFGYRLTEEVYNTPIATFTLTPSKKYQAVLQWHEPPNDENEEVIILLSFIGAMTRLTLKGKDTMEDWPSGKKRWNAFWYSTILGTAGMAG